MRLNTRAGKVVTIIKSIKQEQTSFSVQGLIILISGRLTAFILINYHPLISTAAVICGQLHNRALRPSANEDGETTADKHCCYCHVHVTHAQMCQNTAFKVTFQPQETGKKM